MEHCAISQRSTPFWRWVIQLIINTFLRIAIIPFIHVASWQWALLAIDGPRECPLRHQHSDFPMATRHLLRPQGCKFTMHCLAPASERFLACAQKGFLRRRIGSDFNPGTEANNQGKGPANSPSNNPLPLPHGRGAIGSLCSNGY